jgi:phage gp46-like protein
VLKLVYDNATQRGDLVRTSGANLETDEGLETAVTTSLFSDARSLDSDEVTGDARGWWGSAYLSPANDHGSRLWILKRNKLTNDTLLLASAYTKEALQWLLDARVASGIQATATRLAGTREVAILSVIITRRDGRRFERTWKVQFGN